MNLKSEYTINRKIDYAFYEKTFEKDVIPDEIKRASIQICHSYGIKGLCDPVYISNIIINCINNIDKKGINNG